MQAQLNNLLGQHCTNSRVAIDSPTSFAGSLHRTNSRASISSFVGSTKTKAAFKKFCQNLYQIGVRAEMIREKESEILNIFKVQNTATSGQIDHTGLVRTLLFCYFVGSTFNDWLRPPSSHRVISDIFSL